MPDNSDLRGLRDKYGSSWFFYWRDGKVYALPKKSQLSERAADTVSLPCKDHLSLLGSRLVSLLPEKLSKYRPIRYRPFTFLGPRNLMESCTEGMAQIHDLVRHFSIRPKFELDAKVIEFVDGEPFLGLFLSQSTRWECTAALLELQEAGVDLTGLYVVRQQQPQPGQRRLVGKIGRITQHGVELSESYEGETAIGVDEVWLEGSLASFARCLPVLMGKQYDEFEENRMAQEAMVRTGPAVEELLDRVGKFLHAGEPFQLGGGVSCRVTGRLEVANTPTYRSLVVAPPVAYCFDAARTKRDRLAWPGLERYGPYSRDTFSKKSPNILILFPDTVQGPVENYIRLLKDGVVLPGRQSRYPGGFARIYGLVNPKFILRKVPWFGNGGRNPAALYRKAAEEYLREGESPDAAVIVLLEEHAHLPDAQNPYLHAKALFLMAGIPVQEIRVPTLSKPARDLQYINQDVSLALYAKMNGTPWTVDHDLTISDELVIGMGTCELAESRFSPRRRYIGVTTVFRGDGNYLLSNVSKECLYEEYPDELRESTRAVLRDVKERNGWQPGDTVRIVFHIYKPLKDIEVADITAQCVAELCGEQNVEFAFLTVTNHHPFRLIDKRQRGVPLYPGSPVLKGTFAPERGNVVQIGSHSRLLTTIGANLIKQEGAPLPEPLLIKLHPESTYKDLQTLSEQVLKFTSLSWRSTRPASRPVTIYYSELIAELLARLRAVPDWSPATLNIKLRASRWFL